MSDVLVPLTKSVTRLARVERARHLRPSSRRHTAKRIKQPVRKTVTSLEKERWWACPKCGTGPSRWISDSCEGGFIQEIIFACQCGATKWEDSIEARLKYSQSTKAS